MRPRRDRPAWHSLLLGFVIACVLTVLGVNFWLMLAACAAAGVVLGAYDMAGDRS